MNSTQAPPTYVNDCNGKKIRNPDHIAYLRKKHELEQHKTRDVSDENDTEEKKNQNDLSSSTASTVSTSSNLSLSPPPTYINDINGKKIRNPDHIAYLRMKHEREQHEMREMGDETATHFTTKEKKTHGKGSFAVSSSKYIASGGKTILNPNYYKNHNPQRLRAVVGTIVDLSKDFECPDPQHEHVHRLRSLKANPGARWIESTFGSMPEVKRVTVIEHGKLVADHCNPGVTKNDTHNLFSTTKGVLSMLIGAVMKRTDLKVSDTLEEIFRNNPNAWTCMWGNELEYKKSIRLEELLTMRAGLVSNLGGAKGILRMKEFSVADAPGSDLPSALGAPSHSSKLRGKFHYMPSSNILSYVIKEKTGLSPREFGNQYVFPKLGIDPTKMDWETNRDGIETSYSQLYMTTQQMCKVGQLYLQDGYSSPRDLEPILDLEWIEATFTRHVFGSAGFDHYYGYLWALYDRKYHCQSSGGDIWCAPGFNGQIIAMSRDTNRVVAISRKPVPMSSETLLHYKKQICKLLGKTMSYECMQSNSYCNDGVPKKYFRDPNTNKMVRNPHYNEYMEDLGVRSTCSDGILELRDQQRRRRESNHGIESYQYSHNPYI